MICMGGEDNRNYTVHRTVYRFAIIPGDFPPNFQATVNVANSQIVYKTAL